MDYIATFNGQEVYLEHHGVKGQKWGVRRFQNYDGTRIGSKERNLQKQYAKDVKTASDTNFRTGSGANRVVARAKYQQGINKLEASVSRSNAQQKTYSKISKISEAKGNKEKAARYGKLAQEAKTKGTDAAKKSTTLQDKAKRQGYSISKTRTKALVYNGKSVAAGLLKYSAFRNLGYAASIGVGIAASAAGAPAAAGIGAMYATRILGTAGGTMIGVAPMMSNEARTVVAVRDKR